MSRWSTLVLSGEPMTPRCYHGTVVGEVHSTPGPETQGAVVADEVDGVLVGVVVGIVDGAVVGVVVGAVEGTVVAIVVGGVDGVMKHASIACPTADTPSVVVFPPLR